MKKMFFGLTLAMGIALVACKKDDCECTAKASDGTELYTTDDRATCEDQINTAEGETCSCDCPE